MKRAQAQRVAYKACGQVIRRSRTSYTCIVPQYSNQPDGPTVELQASSYAAIRKRRMRIMAEVALHLMGEWREEGYESTRLINEACAQTGRAAPRDVAEILIYVLRRQRRVRM